MALYAAYAQKRLLPWTRVEFQLAQLSAVLAQTVGGVKCTLHDFILQPVDPAAQAETLKEDIGFKPRVTKRRRSSKKRG